MLCELLAYSRDEEWVTDFWRANSISNTLSLYILYTVFIYIYTTFLIKTIGLFIHLAAMN